ncbi:hypothetical protein LKMONMHP_3977 [Methylobacterium organophilum]|uniref:Uncharacterized protein n=1 Tax=Methylobacterium organophilum TaxID=410 RepID=A0ABQ4TFG2_METOR|nr:hypothetical protein LKMONMHP_3977 [Methylobacterium organophilum]
MDLKIVFAVAIPLATVIVAIAWAALVARGMNKAFV